VLAATLCGRMNRSIALFVALAALVAHVLALHNDGAGGLALPYDQAYAAFRMAHNLVLEGQLQWNPGTTAYESATSPLWVALCTVGERLCATRLNTNTGLLSINLYAQLLGIAAALYLVVQSAQLLPGRVAGLIPPLVLVTSGCIAAAAANGLETALFTLTLFGAFLAFEQGRAGRLALWSVLAIATRSEALVVVLVLLALTPFAPSAARGTEQERPRKLWPLMLALVAFGLTLLMRFQATGNALPPLVTAFLESERAETHGGLEQALEFARTFPAGFLVALPLLMLLAGRLSGTGARALLVAAAWITFVALQGRAPLPFCEAYVPAVPFLAVAIQEGMVRALDSPSMLRRRLAITAFVLLVFANALPSQEPADLGPLPLERWQRVWMTNASSARFGYQERLGREGLQEEIEKTKLLRGVGLFLRDRIEPAHSVLTPWPGAAGYLSGRPLYDVLARTNPCGTALRSCGWSVRTRNDLLAVLRTDPPFDYVTVSLAEFGRVPTPGELAEEWLPGLDTRPDEAGRLTALEVEFARYELVTVPVRFDTRSGPERRVRHVALLRRRELGLAPRLEIVRIGSELRFLARHAAHHQIADLHVRAEDEQGRSWWLSPTGRWSDARPVAARLELLLHDTGTRSIDLVRLEPPETLGGARVTSIEARLVNPAAAGDQPFAWVSEAATWKP